ncbi:MAG: hypothetical protein HY363_06410 [Candidatus Aenigmarchaeota archaeon]|nr:hypothetical protein [Candidatus Aenigmarchaeota archaeon]
MPDEQFIGGVEDKKPVASAAVDVIAQLNTLNGRIRSFERSLSDLRDLLKFQEERVNRISKEVQRRQKDFDDSHHAVVDRLDRLQTEVSLIVRELPLTAKKEDVEVLRRIVEIIKPTRFITQDRAETLVNDILEEKGIIIEGKKQEERF